MNGYATMDKDELREISRRAGIASGEARRKKRAAIEREKVENIAIREIREEANKQYRENLRVLRMAINIAKEAQL